MSLPKPFFDIPFETYWYDHQFVKFLIQFMAIFEGMEVRIGKNDLNSQSDKIYIPIRRGNADRVVNNIISKGSTNTPLRLPLFSAEIVQIEKNEGRLKGREHIQRDVILPVGSEFPDDLQVVYKKTPTPYTLYFDLALFTSNDDHKFQILEQILTIFDPDIQIQSTDDVHHWNKISSLILDTVNLETTYPYGQDQKIVVTTFSFSTVIYLQTPIEFKNNFIKSIKLKIAKLESVSDIYEAYVTDVNDMNPEDYQEIANINEVSEIDKLKS